VILAATTGSTPRRAMSEHAERCRSCGVTWPSPALAAACVTARCATVRRRGADPAARAPSHATPSERPGNQPHARGKEVELLASSMTASTSSSAGADGSTSRMPTRSCGQRAAWAADARATTGSRGRRARSVRSSRRLSSASRPSPQRTTSAPSTRGHSPCSTRGQRGPPASPAAGPGQTATAKPAPRKPSITGEPATSPASSIRTRGRCGQLQGWSPEPRAYSLVTLPTLEARSPGRLVNVDQATRGDLRARSMLPPGARPARAGVVPSPAGTLP
jgi:hypothetical protein